MYAVSLYKITVEPKRTPSPCIWYQFYFLTIEPTAGYHDHVVWLVIYITVWGVRHEYKK